MATDCWLEPSTSKKVEELAAMGKKHLLIIPISFVSDHVETLYELGIEYRHIAESAGIENYIVMTGLNDSSLFIEALRGVVLESMLKKGPTSDVQRPTSTEF